MAISVSAPIVTKLLGTALQRGVSIIFQKISRVRKIDAALKGQLTGNSLVRTAVDDYEVLLGSYYGEFTVAIDGFHRHLEKTGVIEAITESALIGRDSPAIRNMFVREHALFFDKTEGSPEKLYDSMRNAFAVSLQELCKDIVLLKFLTVTHKEISLRLDAIEAAALTYSDRRHSLAAADDAAKANYTRITKGLQQSYKEVRIETIRGGARPVDIDKIYIPPKLSLRDTKSNEIQVR